MGATARAMLPGLWSLSLGVESMHAVQPERARARRVGARYYSCAACPSVQELVHSNVVVFEEFVGADKLATIN
jgi:hypothetical protein